MIPSNLNTHQEKKINPTLVKGIQQTQATNNLKHNTQHPIKKQKKKKTYQECKEVVKYDP